MYLQSGDFSLSIEITAFYNSIEMTAYYMESTELNHRRNEKSSHMYATVATR